MPGELISLTFKLHSLPDYVHVNEGYGGITCSRLALLGSIKELGSWDLRKRIRVFKSADFSKWETQVLVPANTCFEWSWIVTDQKSRKVLFWDSCRRTTTVGSFSGILHTAWGRPEQAFRCDTCRVTISTNYQCEPGQMIVLTGGEPFLGNWDPEHGVVATEEYPAGSGRWTAQLIVEKLSELTWKWVVVDAVSRQAIHWEQGSHHFIYIDHGVSFIEIDSPWEVGDFRLSQNCRFSTDDEDKDNEINALASPHELSALDETGHNNNNFKLADVTSNQGGTAEMARTMPWNFRPGSSNRNMSSLPRVQPGVCPSPSLQQDICASPSFQQSAYHSPSFQQSVYHSPSVPQNVYQSQSFQQSVCSSPSFPRSVCPSPSSQQVACPSANFPQNACPSQSLQQIGCLPQRSDTNLRPWETFRNNSWPRQRVQDNPNSGQVAQNSLWPSRRTEREDTVFREWANILRRWFDMLVQSYISLIE